MNFQLAVVCLCRVRCWRTSVKIWWSNMPTKLCPFRSLTSGKTYSASPRLLLSLIWALFCTVVLGPVVSAIIKQTFWDLWNKCSYHLFICERNHFACDRLADFSMLCNFCCPVLLYYLLVLFTIFSGCRFFLILVAVSGRSSALCAVV